MGKVIMGDIKQTLVDLAQKAYDANIKEDAEFYRNFLIDEAVGVNNFGIVGKLPGIQHGKSKNKNKEKLWKEFAMAEDPDWFAGNYEVQQK